MFNQKEYVNDYIKNNYRCIKLRIRNENKIILHKLDEVDNINKYIIDLILNDISINRKYNFINNEIKIDFPLSKTIKSLIEDAEEADLLNDYGLYMNIADAIDTRAKNEVTHHKMRESEWQTLVRRYRL